jgi:NADH:ubiquinone oxidoreductase subunit E
MYEIVNVKICISTYSYVMGGASLMGIANEIPVDLRDRVKVEGKISLEGGSEETGAKPPFAEVNGIFIQEATTEKIIDLVRKEYSIAKSI